MNNYTYKISRLLLMLSLSSVIAHAGSTDRYDNSDAVVRYTENWSFSMPDQGYIIFDVRADSEVGIAFSDTMDEEDSYWYEVLLGTLGNAMAMIEYNGFYPAESVVKENMLNMETARSFWITIDRGEIKLGEGRTLNQNEMITWNLNDYEDDSSDLGVQYFSFVANGGQASFSNITWGDLSRPEELPQTEEEAVETFDERTMAVTGTTEGKKRTHPKTTTQEPKKTIKKLSKSRSRKAPLTKADALKLRKTKKGSMYKSPTATPTYQAPRTIPGRQTAPRRPTESQQFIRTKPPIEKYAQARP